MKSLISRKVVTHTSIIIKIKGLGMNKLINVLKWALVPVTFPLLLIMVILIIILMRFGMIDFDEEI